MNRLMFAVVGMAIATPIVGCSTVVSCKTVDEQGKERVVEVPVEGSSKAKVERTVARAKAKIEAEQKAMVASGKFSAKGVIPSDAELQEMAGSRLSASELESVRKLVEAVLQNVRRTVVYPAWAENIKARVIPAAESALAKKDYERVRELVWCAATTMVPEVDEVVRTAGIEFLNTRVNPVQWKEIETELVAKADAFAKDAKFDEGIEYLTSYPRIRTYSKNIDKRLAAVQDEIVRLGVDAKGLDPIRAKTDELVAEAAKIVDVRDSVTNTVKTLTQEVAQAIEVDREAYDHKLKEYRETLIRYNCTEANADAIVAAFKASVEPLLQALSKDAVVETTTDTKEFPFMGTMAVNRRTDKKVAELVDSLKAQKDAALRAAREKQIADAIASMKDRALALVAEGKFEDAREVIWQAAATGDLELDAAVFVAGLELLRENVNPANWVAIEAEIKATVSAKMEAKEFDACLDYLTNYPAIRQHSVVLNDQLKRVQEEAEVLGVDVDEATKHAKAACAMVVETADLVDHLDTLKTVGEQPSEEDKAAYQKALKDYAAKLKLYHANPEKVEAIVKTLDEALRSLMRKPGSAEKKLVLGTNAVNDRLADLVAKLKAEVAKAKVEWQEQQFAQLYTDLIARVREAVAQDDFAAAREAIRDERLVGNAVADAKLYALRMGLLDSLVNPRQLESFEKAIDAKAKALIKAKDFKGLKKFIEEYPFVHDSYDQIAAALENIKSSMTALEVTEIETAKTAEKIDKMITALLEGRKGKWSPEFDFSDLEAALGELSEALVAHYYAQPEIKSFCDEIKEEVKDLLDGRYEPMTTAVLNAALERKLAPYREVAEEGICKQEYLALLEKIN